MAGRHKGLLVCQRNVLSRLYGRDGRADPDHADDGRHKDFVSVHGGDLQKPLHAGDDAGLRITDTHL